MVPLRFQPQVGNQAHPREFRQAASKLRCSRPRQRRCRIVLLAADAVRAAGLKDFGCAS
jgi:hypothetical protein